MVARWTTYEDKRTPRNELKNINARIEVIEMDMVILKGIIVEKNKEIRELKETIYGLNTNRNWWRTSALGTEKARAHLATQLVECRNMLDEKDATIDKLNKMYYDSLGGLMRQDNDIDDLQDHRSELERKINSLRAGAKELRKERDDLKTEFENMPRGERFLLARTQSENAELEGKLADRERQFDTLDGVLDRTRELLHAAMDRIQVQNDEITKKDDWISSYSKNDKRLNRLLDELRVDVRKRDKIIDELMGERTQ